MAEPIKLDYVRETPRVGHSCYSIASISLAAAGLIFTILAGLVDITPFKSLGNQKETLVASVAAILGILLSLRALQDWNKKHILAIWGMVLNAIALVAAMVLLPCL